MKMQGISTESREGTNRNGEMRYEHSFEETAEYLRLTLGFLGQHNLPTNPLHFTVCYEYVSKQNPRLVYEVEKTLTESRSVTPELSNYWFYEYVAYREQALIHSIKTDLLSILKEIVTDLSATGSDLSAFGKSLALFSEEIAEADDGDALQKSLKGLLLAVKNGEKSSAALELRLKHANEEVESLQQKLREAEQHATTDGLTGLWNRRSFEEKMKYHIARSIRKEGDLSLAIFDVDHFKRINDTYGHLAGDDLLRIIAKVMKDFVKGKDVVCRYGGEEFVILLPDTPLTGAITVAEKIRKYFSEMSWRQKSTGISMGKVTLSAGVSALRPGEKYDSFVQRADVALYNSKKMGRNRVSIEKKQDE